MCILHSLPAVINSSQWADLSVPMQKTSICSLFVAAILLQKVATLFKSVAFQPRSPESRGSSPNQVKRKRSCNSSFPRLIHHRRPVLIRRVDRLSCLRIHSVHHARRHLRRWLRRWLRCSRLESTILISSTSSAVDKLCVRSSMKSRPGFGTGTRGY